VRLAASAFYPTSGGQPHDLGRLDGVEVLDVTLDEDGVWHRVAAPPTPGRAATWRAARSTPTGARATASATPRSTCCRRRSCAPTRVRDPAVSLASAD
jgi:hypothetical protein